MPPEEGMEELVVTSKWSQNKEIISSCRGHSVKTDLSVNQGGDDLYSTPLELALMGLSSCFLVTFQSVSEKMILRIDRLDCALTVTKDDQGNPSQILLLLTVASRAPREQLKRCFTLSQNCPVLNLFKKAVTVKEELAII
jgi:uncharacterized OsmC-like protein